MVKMILVDCEADGPCPGKGNLTEIGAVLFDDTTRTFHARVQPVWPGVGNYDEATRQARSVDARPPEAVMRGFAEWIERVTKGDRPVFVSDNPAFDFQWVNWYAWHYLGHNPFGHSARRIGDIYAGLMRDMSKATAWKRLRDTPHDHNPVHDALGNAEALAKIIRMMETPASPPETQHDEG